MSQAALRASLIWHDEVMEDVVLDTPKPITLGRTGRSTFTIPEVGLPQEFAIVRPGNRGYLLTLGERMRGTIHVDGETKNVADFVSMGEGEELGGASGGFRATPIGAKDWGVIDLDESGHYKLFFQFVDVAPPHVLVPDADLLTSMARVWATSAIFINLFVPLVAYLGLGDMGILEWVFRGSLLLPAATSLFGIGWSLITSDPETQASNGFSALLHGALLGWVFWSWPKDNEYKYPGPRAITANYLVARMEPPPEPEKLPTEVTKAEKADQGANAPEKKKDTEVQKKQEQMQYDAGASGGGNDHRERGSPTKAPDIGLTSTKAQKQLDDTMRKADAAVADVKERLAHLDGALGGGRDPGTGGGTNGGGNGPGALKDGGGNGPGGGGKDTKGEHKASKGPDTGKDREGGGCPGCEGTKPKPVEVAIDSGTGDFGGYSEDEINRVIRGRSGLFKTCYQKELNHTPGLAGKVVVKFKIGPDGKVQSANRAGGTSLASDAVTSCVTMVVAHLSFPPKGAIANVVYPFVFTQGG